MTFNDFCKGLHCTSEEREALAERLAALRYKETVKLAIEASGCSKADDLLCGMREIYEVWAGSEECAAATVVEGYQQRLIHEMRDIAARYLKREAQ
ncbi:MAG: hypothetical protein KDA17_07870 [Candidatus Saccharibacteria bacterium]|nr:hypothetical protein [Candidatus Saccharibacteria bacterium]